MLTNSVILDLDPGYPNITKSLNVARPFSNTEDVKPEYLINYSSLFEIETTELESSFII
jgi:hypothetical protein